MNFWCECCERFFEIPVMVLINKSIKEAVCVWCGSMHFHSIIKETND